MAADTAPDQQYDTPKSIGTAPDRVWKRWMMEIESISKNERDWRALGRQVLDRYHGDYAYDKVAMKAADSYNILFSNTDTKRPVLYNTTPQPDVKRRWRDADAVGMAASEVLRRAIKYSVDSADFDEIANKCILDMLLPGRGCIRVRYVPTIDGQQEDAAADAPAARDDDKAAAPGGGDQDSAAGAGAGVPSAPSGAAPGDQDASSNAVADAQTDELVFEEARFEYVPWNRLRIAVADTWAQVDWLAFEHELTRQELVDRFGAAIGNEVNLNVSYDDSAKDREQRPAVHESEIFKRATVHEVWDKQARKVIFVAPGYNMGPLKTVKDPLNLTGFFPTPRPVYAVETTGTMIPVPPFKLYMSLANELEVITNRIAKVTRAIRARGVYPKEIGEIETMLSSAETSLTGSDKVLKYIELAKGDFSKLILWMPLEQLISTLAGLYQRREDCKAAIWEIDGIADIMRGVSDPRETAKAQQLKQNWGSLRVRRQQAEVQRFCRDLFAMCGELIAENFDAKTLAMITGLKLPTNAEKQAIQQRIQALQPRPPIPGMPPPPPMPQPSPQEVQQAQQTMAKPSWEDVMTVLRSNCLRSYRIDIQTDSTVGLQDSEDQADMQAAMAAVGQMLGELMPLVQQGLLPFDVAKELVLCAVRKFSMGEEVELAVEQMVQPQQPDPSQSKEVIIAKMKNESDAQTAQIEAQARVQADAAIHASKAKSELMGMGIDKLGDYIIAKLKAGAQIEAARVSAGIGAGSDIALQLIEGGQDMQQTQVQGAQDLTAQHVAGAQDAGAQDAAHQQTLQQAQQLHQHALQQQVAGAALQPQPQPVAAPQGFMG